MNSAMPKLWTIQRALRVRRKFPECFDASGVYTPLEPRGNNKSNMVAFLRGNRVATIAPRLTQEIANGWGDTDILLPQGRWTNVFTDDTVEGGSIKMEQLLSRFPIALLTKDS
jgi:(1->4)-alpha-D-glucan 1-alpha-D-glucosylmutase